MPTSQLVLDTITQLKSALVADGTLILTLGKTAVADGLGGFYRWDASSTATEDMTNLNVIASSKSATGRWIRVFQRIRTTAGGGQLILNGGAKTLFLPSLVTDANGQVKPYLTEDGTANGTALFNEVWMAVAEAKPANLTDPNNVVIGNRVSLVSNQLTFQFSTGNKSLISLLGVNILGMRIPPTGTPVALRVDGA